MTEWDQQRSNRRFPPPWTIARTSGGHFKVLDASGQELASVYVREAGVGIGAPGLEEDEARRIAANIAKLPELLGKEPKP